MLSITNHQGNTNQHSEIPVYTFDNGVLHTLEKTAHVDDDMKKLDPSCTAGRNVRVQLLWKMVQQFLKMLNTEFPYEQAVALAGMSPKEMKTYAHTKTCTWIFIGAAFIIVKGGGNQISINRYVDKHTIYLYYGILFIHKKE